MHRRLLGSFALATVAILAALNHTTAADWPQWQGPDRTGVSKETGLLKQWPKEGPPLAWKATNLGGGYSTPCVAKGRVFGMGYRHGAKIGRVFAIDLYRNDEEIVWALDEKTGHELWATKIASRVGGVGYGEGPRCTPTIDGNKLYALGVDGDLVCLDVEKGKELWHKSLKKDFGGGRPGWGFCESPLIDGDKLIITPGGKNTIVALDKNSGETIWKAAVPKGDGAHYSSAIVAEIAGQRQYIQFVAGGVISVGASDGEFLWRYDAPHNGTANCSTPIFSDGRVFAASSYGTGGGLAEISKADGKYDAKQVYFEKKMQNHHGGMVLVDGYLYGEGGGRLRCIEFKTGNAGWDDGKPGKGSIAYADGLLYYRNEGKDGEVFLVEANSKEYVEKGRFKQPERSKHNAWPHPVIANGKLYLRDQNVLLCYDIKAK